MDIRQWVRASRAAQGLPEVVTDPAVLARAAVLVYPAVVAPAPPERS